MEKINWAILAPGKIARDFAVALQGVETAKLYSVASRNPKRAKSFAAEFGFETYANSYAELIADNKIDAFYIASPHNFHAEQSIACLSAGKAVLCEKPMTINSQQARAVFTAARENRTFYMEAVWTRFMPIQQQIRAWIDDGAIGDVQMVQASLGFAIPYDPAHRLYDLNLAGGALLDVGIYPLTFAQWIMQEEPSELSALGHIGPSGVDERIEIVHSYSNGAVAALDASIMSVSSHKACVFGSQGRITVPKFWCAEEASLIVDEVEETIKIPHAINGYEGEIEEVHRCLRAGLLESSKMSWADSLNTMAVMDQVRKQIGLRYPMEN